MINLVTMTKLGRQLLGGAFALAAVAVATLATAAPAAAQTTSTQEPATTTAPASGTTANNAGATSGGGSFFTPPERAKEGALTADQALKSTEVPEPGMFVLFGGGALAMIAIARRRRRK